MKRESSRRSPAIVSTRKPSHAGVADETSPAATAAAPTGRHEAPSARQALCSSGWRRQMTIEPNGPVLAAKRTGPGQRASLSAVIHPGMKAVTVRVSDVEGVAGFVLPGDRVDVLLTRRSDKSGMTDVVLQNAPVLAIDQLADERTDKPTIAKAVTLEVDTVAAQKLTLSAQLGVLSLALRKAGEPGADESRRISADDIGRETAPAEGPKHFSTVTVTRASKKQDYSVPSESAADWRETNGVTNAASAR